jgi:hypothetical protein
MNRINQALDELHAMSNHDELVGERLATIFAGAKALVRINSQQAQHIQNADKHLNAVQAERDELLRQRDTVLDEFSTFINDMKAGEFWNHEDTREIFDAAVEEHDEMFWTSLPYEIASKIGGQWQFFDADLLYDVLTNIDEEEFAYGRGFQVADVRHFKDALLNLVRELSQKEGRSS